MRINLLLEFSIRLKSVHLNLMNLFWRVPCCAYHSPFGELKGLLNQPYAALLVDEHFNALNALKELA